MRLEPGHLVSKQVRLVRMLSGGGMGSVWIADHLGLQTQVAVKFILGNHAQNPALLARFKREATSAARIKSPHVVQIHDHGVTDDGDPFMVMELLEGEDLSTRLKRIGRMPLDEVATIVQQTCRVLAKAHQLGVVHRDIKPGNMFLIETDGEIFIKLLDFGVAKIGGEGSELTTTGVLVGTMVYMSPEQLLDARSVDHRADLWSLAVVVYRAITARLPFKDDRGLGALVLALDGGIYQPPSELVPNLPKEVDAWFATAFRRQPSERFSSAKEMSREFSRAVGRPDDLSTSSTSVAWRPEGEAMAPGGHVSVDTLSDRHVQSASQSRPRPGSTDDPATVGATVRLSLPATEERPRSARRRSALQRLVMVLTALLFVGGAGLFVYRARLHAGRSPALASSAGPPPSSVVAGAAASASGAPRASASVDFPIPAPGARASDPGPTTSATVPVASASSAAPAGSTRVKGRMPGSSNPKSEKDYGF